MVDALRVGGGGGWAEQGEVPFEEVGIGDGLGVEGWVRCVGGGGTEFECLAEEAANRRRRRHFVILMGESLYVRGRVSGLEENLEAR